MTTVYAGQPSTVPFPARLRGTGRWRRALAHDARRWSSADTSELGDLDPFKRAASRYAAELELTATVYGLIYDGLTDGGSAHA